MRDESRGVTGERSEGVMEGEWWKSGTPDGDRMSPGSSGRGGGRSGFRGGGESGIGLRESVTGDSSLESYGGGGVVVDGIPSLIGGAALSSGIVPTAGLGSSGTFAGHP